MTLLFTRLSKVYNEEDEREGYCVYYKNTEGTEYSVLLEISTTENCCEVVDTGIELNGERLEHVEHLSVSNQLELQEIGSISGLVDNTRDNPEEDPAYQEMYFLVNFESGDILKVLVSNTHNGYYPHTGYFTNGEQSIRFNI